MASRSLPRNSPRSKEQTGADSKNTSVGFIEKWSQFVSTRPRTAIWTETLIIYAIALAYMAWRQFLSPHIPDSDGYYHIKLAYIYRTEGIVPGAFKWAQFSFWKDHFFDKDFGFHLLLIPFTFGDLIFGAKLASAVMGSFIFASFYYVLRAMGVRHAWFFTFILVISGGYFGYRINVPRSQILAMSFGIWSMYYVLIRSWKGVLFTGILFALTYTAPFLITIYALLAGLIFYAMDNDKNLKIIAMSFLGVFLGWLIHPHFPNNFLFIKVQIFDLLTNKWGGQGPNLSLGGEMQPAPGPIFLREHGILLALFLAALLSLPKLKVKFNSKMVVTFVFTILWFIVSVNSKRFVEYMVPISIWFSALVLNETWPEFVKSPPEIWKKTWVRYALSAGFAFGIGAATVHSHIENRGHFRGAGPAGLKEAALLLKEKGKKDQQVYTCDWDDAPELFFYNSDQLYIVFLDPTFMYKWNPDVWSKWHRIANGNDKTPADSIVKNFGAHLGMCTGNFGDLRQQLKNDPRVKITNAGDAYVFEIDPSVKG